MKKRNIEWRSYSLRTFHVKAKPKKENKTSKSVWLRFGAIAACFLLIVSAVIVVPMLREDEPGIIPML